MNERDFAEIVGRTKKVVLSAIEKNLASRFYHSIDDVVQETYLRAYSSLTQGKFRGESSINTWLYSIARNESLRMNEKLLKEEKKEKKLINADDLTENYEDDSIALLQENILKLPDKYGAVLSLVSSGYSLNQISEKLGLNTGTVKSRISRGKKILHDYMKGGKDAGL
jgi:RNA polymerase sigma-70 factor (ECF subfamily)